MDEGKNTASSFIWALAFIIVAAMIVGALYYSGFLTGKKKTEIDINVTAPNR